MKFDTTWEQANIEAGNEALLEKQVDQWHEEMYLESIGQGFDYWEAQWEMSLEHERTVMQRLQWLAGKYAWFERRICL